MKNCTENSECLYTIDFEGANNFNSAVIGAPQTENILVKTGKVLPVTTLLKSAVLVSICYVIKRSTIVYCLSHMHVCTRCALPPFIC